MIPHPLRSLTRSVAVVSMLAAVTGCGASIPSDPEGTLADASGGVLSVGVSPEPGLVEMADDRAVGPLARLVEGFASRVDAEVRWVEGSEETLVESLETGAVDVAVGGFGEQTPWEDRVGVSRGYDVGSGADRATVTVLVPLGENALLSELETFLDEEAGA